MSHYWVSFQVHPFSRLPVSCRSLSHLTLFIWFSQVSLTHKSCQNRLETQLSLLFLIFSPFASFSLEFLDARL
jgi:hypothetical protein